MNEKSSQPMADDVEFVLGDCEWLGTAVYIDKGQDMTKILIDRSVVEQALVVMDAIIDAEEWLKTSKARKDLRAALAEQPAEQRSDSEHMEPVAWTDEDYTEIFVSKDIAEDMGASVALYTAPHPAQQCNCVKREPLTLKEVDAVMRQALGYGLSPSRDDLELVRAIERYYGIGGQT